MTQFTQCLFGRHTTQGLIPKSCTGYDPGTLEVEARGSEVKIWYFKVIVKELAVFQAGFKLLYMCSLSVSAFPIARIIVRATMPSLNVMS